MRLALFPARARVDSSCQGRGGPPPGLAETMALSGVWPCPSQRPGGQGPSGEGGGGKRSREAGPTVASRGRAGARLLHCSGLRAPLQLTDPPSKWARMVASYGAGGSQRDSCALAGAGRGIRGAGTVGPKGRRAHEPAQPWERTVVGSLPFVLGIWGQSRHSPPDS